MLPNKLTPLGVLSILFCTTVWGGVSIATKFAVTTTEVSTFNAYRFLCVLPFVFFVKKPRISWVWLVLISLTWSGLNFFFLGLAIKLGLPPGTCMFTFQTNTLFALIFSWAFLKEKIPTKSAVALALCFSGLYFLMLSGGKNGSFSWIGFGSALLAAFIWGLGFLCVKKADCEDKAALNIWASLFSFLFFGIFDLVVNGPENIALVVFEWQSNVLFSAFFAGVVGSVMANSLWYRLVGKYSAATLMPFMIFVPVISLGLSMVFFGETLSFQKGVACCLIITGLLVNHFGSIPLSIWLQRLRRSQGPR